MQRTNTFLKTGAVVGGLSTTFAAYASLNRSEPFFRRSVLNDDPKAKAFDLFIALHYGVVGLLIGGVVGSFVDHVFDEERNIPKPF